MYLNARIELKDTLKTFDIATITWEGDRPGGAKISEGEQKMITESDACCFLIGQEASRGTLDEYRFAKELNKPIIIVDASPLEGVPKNKIDRELFEEIYEPEKAENNIILDWQGSRSVANQIKEGLSLRFPSISFKPTNNNSILSTKTEDLIIELKKLNLKGDFPLICISHPSTYNDTFFDITNDSSYYMQILDSVGTACLPSYGSNSEFELDCITRFDSSNRGKVSLFSTGHLFFVSTLARVKPFSAKNEKIGCCILFERIHNFLYLLSKIHEKDNFKGFLIIKFIILNIKGIYLVIDLNREFLHGTVPPCKLPEIMIPYQVNLQDIASNDQLLNQTTKILKKIVPGFNYSPNASFIILNKCKFNQRLQKFK